MRSQIQWKAIKKMLGINLAAPSPELRYEKHTKQPNEKKGHYCI